MKKLKLNQISKSRIEKKQLQKVRGGGVCGCGCYYSGSGGSSTDDNAVANSEKGLRSVPPENH